MDKHGVGMMILSITSPGPQGEADQKKCEALATRCNDYMSDICKKMPTRFTGLASVSMHDPAQAAKELTRSIKELGLVGCMLNDFQSSGPDGDTMLHYDNENYDVFWKTVQDLDVPVYMHPRLASPSINKLLWQDRPGLGTQIFCVGVSIHTLGLISNGVFDRFPGVQFVIGHFGEGLIQDLWRIDHWWERSKRVRMKCKHNAIYYFKKNVHITTSGHYSTPTLKMAIETIGSDRIMFSIDTAYEYTEEGCNWWDNVDKDIGEADQIKMGRDNVIKLFKLKNVPLT